MKIEINDETKLRTAVNLANNREYQEALAILGRLDSYESRINQILCLCEMHEEIYASEVYRNTRRLYPEYALYKDIRKNFPLTKGVFMLCEVDAKSAKTFDGELRAKKDLVANLDKYVGTPHYSDMPDMDYIGDADFLMDESYPEQKIFDVNSEAYFENLRILFEKSLMKGDEKQAKSYAKKILAVDTMHVPTLEVQTSLCLFEEKYKKGMVFAERIAKAEGITMTALDNAIEIVMHCNPEKNMEVLRALLHRLLDVMDDIHIETLENYLYLITTLLEDTKLAYLIAKRCYPKVKNASVSCYKACSIAFLNNNDVELAREAAYEYYRAVPFNVSARMYYQFINNTEFDGKQEMINIPHHTISGFDVPGLVVIYAQEKLKECFDQSAALTKKSLYYITLLSNYCRFLTIVDQEQEYLDALSAIGGCILNLPIEDNDAFLEFAKSQLCYFYDDKMLNSFIITRLVRMGCKETVFVCYANQHYYKLDLSILHEYTPLYLESMSLLAALQEMPNTDQYENAYDTLKVFLKSEDTKYVRQMAFAMNLFVKKRGIDQNAYEYFDGNDMKLYQKYIKDIIKKDEEELKKAKAERAKNKAMAKIKPKSDEDQGE